MKLPNYIKQKIESMISHSRKAVELRGELEAYLVKALKVEGTDDLDTAECGIMDQIIDNTEYSFNADGLIKYLEEDGWKDAEV